MRENPHSHDERSDGTDSLVEEFNDWIEELGANPELVVEEKSSASVQLEQMRADIQAIRMRVNEYVSRKERAFDVYKENLVPDQRRIWVHELRDIREIQAMLRGVRLR